MIGLLQVLAPSDAHPGLSHLNLVLEFYRPQEERFLTVSTTLKLLFQAFSLQSILLCLFLVLRYTGLAIHVHISWSV